jgi:flagellar biosynthesis chaperone FliJ
MSKEGKSYLRIDCFSNTVGFSILTIILMIRTNNEEEKSMDKEISTEKTPIRIHTKLKKRREIFVSSSQYGATPYNIEAITSSIQKIARSAAPIGQVMNYLPSDLAKMNKERDHWKLLFTKRRKAFNEAKEVTETELSPLQHQIQVVDEEIEQVKRMIATAKKKIILNDEWIKDRLQKFMRAYAIRQ